ncbi:septum formation inhibitor Maf [Sulfurimonas sp. HSL3-7]|uniref:septum formation inhibitor Maf n=1 Tax=Sulfonitrofixus jiaomeiensis TaxID=3131938 RepID=UPI0031F7A224
MDSLQIRLCSQSESRASILRNAGISFVQSPVDFDEEQIIADSPKNFVYQATLGKFEAAKKSYDYRDMPLLVSDTVVTSQDRILRKANSLEEAREILQTQSGSVTSIVTCMIYKSEKLELLDISSTDYLFDTFDTDELEAYLHSGEWKGKAGGCMVEGFCKPYIREVKGYESCAMGLSVEVLKTFITLR